MMWVLAAYQATTLFSLKPATATASGGRTLLVPTPFAIKMALLGVACQLEGQAQAATHWDTWMGGGAVALSPAPQVVVNNTFGRILRPPKSPEPFQPFQRTIAYREYAQLDGEFGIAFEVETEAQARQIGRWFAHINYFGKRGGFVQIQDVPVIEDTLPAGYIEIGAQLDEGFALDALLTQLDDTGEGASFDVVNIYSGKRITMGKHRVLYHVALPYQRVSSSRGYTHYRLQGGQDPGNLT